MPLAFRIGGWIHFAPDNTPPHLLSITSNSLTSVISISLSQHKWLTLGEDVEDSDEGAVVTVAGVVEEVVVALAKTRRKSGTHSFAGFLHD